MANLNSGQIKELASSAGFSGDDLNISVAIALAESGGNPNAHNTKGKDDSYGLWQINMKGGLGPDRRKRYNIAKNEDLFDPKTNARVAYAIYKDHGGKFDPWTTFTAGKYKSILEKFKDDPFFIGSIRQGGENVVEDTATEAGISGALNTLGQNLFKSLANTTGIGLAAMLILGGVALLIFGSKTVQKSSIKLAKTALTKGKA